MNVLHKSMTVEERSHKEKKMCGKHRVTRLTGFCSVPRSRREVTRWMCFNASTRPSVLEVESVWEFGSDF